MKILIPSCLRCCPTTTPPKTSRKEQLRILLNALPDTFGHCGDRDFGCRVDEVAYLCLGFKLFTIITLLAGKGRGQSVQITLQLHCEAPSPQEDGQLTDRSEWRGNSLKGVLIKGTGSLSGLLSSSRFPVCLLSERRNICSGPTICLSSIFRGVGEISISGKAGWCCCVLSLSNTTILR